MQNFIDSKATVQYCTHAAHKSTLATTLGFPWPTQCRVALSDVCNQRPLSQPVSTPDHISFAHAVHRNDFELHDRIHRGEAGQSFLAERSTGLLSGGCEYAADNLHSSIAPNIFFESCCGMRMSSEGLTGLSAVIFSRDDRAAEVSSRSLLLPALKAEDSADVSPLSSVCGRGV